MDYNIIWFILLVVLFVGYVVLDGFDLGVGMLHLGAKDDMERRLSLNSIGPVWDANEVWLITAGGALFAAFPDVYATVFSGFYTAFMLFLLVIIGRAVSIEFRSKVETQSWRNLWDVVFSISSLLIALLLGVSLGNIVSGVPVAADKEFAGTFFGLLHPYALLLGLTAVFVLRMHGKLYLIMKLKNGFQQRLIKSFKLSWMVGLIFYIALTIWTWIAYPHMTEKYFSIPVWFVVPILAYVSWMLILPMMNKQKYTMAFIYSSLALVASVVMVAIGIFPNLLLSSPEPANSLNIFNASSSQLTLKTMFIIACIGVPIMLVYKIIVYRVFSGKTEVDESSY